MQLPFLNLLNFTLVKKTVPELRKLPFPVELPNVKFVSCDGISLHGFDKCLSVKFSYLEEYAGLKEQGSPDVLVGKLYGLDGTENEDSRVSASFESDSDFFVRKKNHMTYCAGKLKL